MLLTCLGLLLTATAALPIVGGGSPATHVANRAGHHGALSPLDVPEDTVVAGDPTTSTTDAPQTTTTNDGPHTTPTTFPPLADTHGDDHTTTTEGPQFPPVVANPKITQFALANNDSYPQDIVLGPDGALWFTEEHGPTIGRITTDGHIDEFPLAAPFATPTQIVVGSDGALWFGDANAPFIGRITTSGEVTSYSTGAGNGDVFSLGAGPDGALWFTTYDHTGFGRMATNGTVTTFPSALNPQYIGPGPGNYVWATSTGIVRISPDGSQQNFAPLPPGDGYVNRLTTGPDGAIWFTYNSGSVEGIGRMTPSGDSTLMPIPDFCGDQLVFDRANELWVSGFRCNPQKLFRVVFGGGLTVFDISRPQDLVIGPDGNVWFANDLAAGIGRVGLDGS